MLWIFKWERKRILGATQRKFCQTSGCSQRKPSCTFRQETALRGATVCHGWRKVLLMKFWAILQDYKLSKRGHYIYVGWGNTYYLGSFCSPRNNGRLGGQSGVFKPHYSLPFLSWEFHPTNQRQNTKILLQISSPLQLKNHISKATL